MEAEASVFLFLHYTTKNRSFQDCKYYITGDEDFL